MPISKMPIAGGWDLVISREPSSPLALTKEPERRVPSRESRPRHSNSNDDDGDILHSERILSLGLHDLLLLGMVVVAVGSLGWPGLLSITGLEIDIRLATVEEP